MRAPMPIIIAMTADRNRTGPGQPAAGPETGITALLRLQAWLSPGFPIGGYSYSHGLEYAVSAGWVSDRAGLVDWLEADLRFGAGRADATFFAAAWVAASRGDEAGFVAVAELASAFRSTAELALESAQQGASFLSTVGRVTPAPGLARLAAALDEAGIGPALPVAVAAAAAAHGISRDCALPLWLQASVANLVSAGVRLIPLGQTDGQLALAALEGAVAEVAAAAGAADLESIGGAALRIDIASARHETQYTRLFRS